MQLKDICNKYDILNYNEVQRLVDLEEPLVTVAMLSFKRFDILIKALKTHLRNGTPLNLVLRVQCCEDLSDKQKLQITDLAKQFHGHDLQFTRTNIGSGVPRHGCMKKAIENFDTPYILTTDDDMIWPKYSILAQVSLLERMKEYGIVSSTCLPNYPIKYRLPDGTWTTERPVAGQGEFYDAEMIGSATSVYRREVFDTCEYDKRYIIGCGDYDLCLQIIEAGWKIGVLNTKELQTLNDISTNTPLYNRMRYNREIIQKSIALFKRKWNIKL